MTQTLSKPAKAARTIVSTKVTTEGVKSTLTASAGKQLEATAELCRLIANVPQFTESANAAAAALSDLINLSEDQ